MAKELAGRVVQRLSSLVPPALEGAGSWFGIAYRNPVSRIHLHFIVHFDFR
jgi:hypothetical protein